MVLLSCIFFIFVCMSSGIFSAIVTPLPRALNVTCDVDYRGLIVFNINLPNQYVGTDVPKFFYKNKNMEKWVEQNDCYYLKKDGKNMFLCSMAVLTDSRKIDTIYSLYYFKVVMLIDGQEYVVEKFTLSKYNDKMLTPWTYYLKLSYCADSYGVKYIATNSTENKVFVEWILHPINADSDSFSSRITIEGDNREKEIATIQKAVRCRGDLCSYRYSDLNTCAKYQICIETDDSFGTNTRTTCKNVHTYCNGEDAAVQNEYLEWKDALLCICGFVMLIVCSFVLWALCRKHSRLNANPIFNEVIDEDDLLRPASANERKDIPDMMMTGNQFSQYMFMDEINNGVIVVKS